MLNTRFTLNGKIRGFLKDRFKTNLDMRIIRQSDAKQSWSSVFRNSFIDDNTLTVNVTRLRKKLEEAGLTDFIQTKKGVGYLIA